MDDPELEAIRARRLAELQARSGQARSAAGGLPGMPSMPSGAGSDENSKKSEAEEMRRNMLFQILDNQARERLARIRIVKNDKARAIEDMLLRMVQTGQLRSKVSETQLIDMLEQINSQNQSATKITYNRRKSDSDDEEDWDL